MRSKIFTVVVFILFSSITMSAQENLKSARVKFVKLDKSPSYEKLEEIFSNKKILSYPINCVNWPERNNGYTPEASFKVIYSKTHLYIRYQVKEKALRATFSSDEGCKPWTEDCMELFISPNPDSCQYFNIEMSCIGYGIVGKRTCSEDKERLLKEELDKIVRISTLGRKPFGDRVVSDDCPEKFYEWSMIIAIPLDILCGAKGYKLLKGKDIRANVYKCGDNMLKPHYLSWSPIGTPKPNFHTPEYFGVFHFE